MQFYTGQRQYYCGIDLHAKAMYVCILDGIGTIIVCSPPDGFFPRESQGGTDPVAAATAVHRGFCKLIDTPPCIFNSPLNDCGNGIVLIHTPDFLCKCGSLDGSG